MTNSNDRALPRIAVVEDDPDQRASMQEYLQLQGYGVWAVESAEDFYRRLAVEPADIVVLDIGLPGEDGFETAAHIRQINHIGIIMVSARSGLSDRLTAMDSGADSYLVKPVELRELLAHIQALWRRLQGRGGSEAGGGWRLFRRERALSGPDGQRVSLTPNEFALMECLVAHDGEAPRGAIAESLGNDANHADYHRIDVLLSRLRKKVLNQSGAPLPVASAPAQRLALTEPVTLA